MSIDFYDQQVSNSFAKQYNKDMNMDKTFKAGDRVIEKISSRTSGVRDEGEITKKHDRIPNAWWVQWLDDTVAWIAEKDIELIEDEQLVNPDTSKSQMSGPDKPVDNNPKTLVALSKPKLSDVPPVALFALGAAMSDGASKYGRYNYRDTSATASVFYDAIMRHLVDWYNGEDFAHDSNVNHLGHIMASCAILLDAELNGSFVDDRDKRHPESIARNKTWIKS